MAETILRKLKRYCNDVISGEIISCKKHIQACKRFQHDLIQSKRKDAKWLFDESRVAQFVRWVTLFKHTKGVLANTIIELHISALFIVANIYGWYNKRTGYRRFNRVYFQVGRKNAKSQLASLIALYEMFVFSKDLSEVYTAATKRKQARVVYDESHRMLEKAPQLKGKWKETYNVITHIGPRGTGSFMTTLSKEDEQKGDAYNPQCAIIDEYHLHETNGYVSAMSTGMGARPEPLLFIITTAGFDLSRPCYKQEYKLASRILDPDNPIDMENMFADIHEMEINDTEEVQKNLDGKEIAPGELIDEITLENLQKANPIVCSYPEGRKYLLDQLKEAREIPEKMRDFLTKHCNIWVNQRDTGYMPLQRWQSCAFSPKSDLFKVVSERCWLGLDLSGKLDLTSMGVVVPRPESKYVVFGHSFMPETTFRKHLAKKTKVPFDLWEKHGYLTVTKGDVVNYREVIQYCKDFIEEKGLFIQEWCVDPWGSLQISADLIEEGYEVVDIIQGIKTLSEPTKTFRDEVYDQNIIHEGNPVISWAIGNAVIDSVDKNLNFMLSKKKSIEKIDPIASIINAFVRAMVADTININGYDEHELRFL